MNKKRIIYIIILILIVYIFLNYYGKKFVKRLNTFIIESNNLYINKEINTYIKRNKLIDTNNLYMFSYDNKNNITGASLNVKKINSVLTKYLDDFSTYLDNTKFETYLKKYYKYYNINGKNYLTMPIGIVYNNPFLFNIGPNIILSYDDILLINVYFSFDYKKYGINSIITNIYLNIDVEQKIIKPILEKNNKYNYKIFISSEILNGSFSGLISNGFSINSDGVSTS